MATDTTTRTPTSSNGSGWRTVEVVSVAIVGVVFGVVYWGWNQAYAGFEGVKFFAGPATGLLGGPWLIAGVVGGLLVRRPGAALFAEVLAAAVSTLLGNQWGAATLVSGMLQGLGVEVALALFAFRYFGVVAAVMGGILAAAAETAYEWDAYWAAMSTDWKLQYLAWFALSGALIAGVGGWLITRALAATGAVDGLAAGRAAAEKQSR